MFQGLWNLARGLADLEVLGKKTALLSTRRNAVNRLAHSGLNFRLRPFSLRISFRASSFDSEIKKMECRLLRGRSTGCLFLNRQEDTYNNKGKAHLWNGKCNSLWAHRLLFLFPSRFLVVLPNSLLSCVNLRT